MFPIKRRKLWPFRTKANSMYFTIWLLVAVVIWLSWLFTSKFRLENTASDGGLLYHVSDNVGGVARSVVVRDGTVECSDLQVNDCALASIRGKGGLIAIDSRRKITVTNAARIDNGVLVCESLVADDIMYEDSYWPMTTTAEECTIITSPEEEDAEEGHYLVCWRTDEEKLKFINLLSESSGRSLAVSTTNDKASIKTYSLSHFLSGAVHPLPVYISPQIVSEQLPRPNPSLLYVTGSGEVRSLPLPNTVKPRVLTCAGRDALEWDSLPAGAWFQVDNRASGRHDVGNVLHFDGGGRVSFRAFHKPVNSGNVSVLDPEAPLDLTVTSIPPFVQFDKAYGRLTRAVTANNVAESQNVAYILSCVRRQSKLDSLTQTQWKNEQDLFDQISIAPSDSNDCNWIVYDEREARLRSDLLLSSPSLLPPGRLVLGCKGGKFTWTPFDRYVVLSSANTYDAGHRRLRNAGAPQSAGDAVRLVDLQHCLSAYRHNGWNAKTKEINNVGDGTEDDDAVNLGQCKNLFGVSKDKDGFYDAKDKPINNLGNAIEQSDAVSKETVDALHRQYRSWFKVEYGYKTDVETLHSMPTMHLLSHEAVNGGFLVPFSDMTLDRAYLYTSDGPVKVLISTQSDSKTLEKRNEEQLFKMFRLNMAMTANTIVKAYIESEEGGTGGIERKYLLTLFFRNHSEFFKT